MWFNPTYYFLQRGCIKCWQWDIIFRYHYICYLHAINLFSAQVVQIYQNKYVVCAVVASTTNNEILEFQQISPFPINSKAKSFESNWFQQVAANHLRSIVSYFLQQKKKETQNKTRTQVAFEDVWCQHLYPFIYP